MLAQEMNSKEIILFFTVNKFFCCTIFNQSATESKKSTDFSLLFYTFVLHEKKAAHIKCFFGTDSIVLNIVSVHTQL